MKLIAFFTFLLSVSAAHAVQYNLKCNVADSAKTVTLSQDPRGLLSCQVNATTKLAEVSLRSKVDMTVGGESYVIAGDVNSIALFYDCRQAVIDAERLFSARITDKETGAAYTLELSNSDSIRIWSNRSECVGKLLK
jgi:hypothetical protein